MRATLVWAVRIGTAYQDEVKPQTRQLWRPTLG